MDDIIAAVEAERRRMARELDETVISQLTLMLSQASAYEQTLSDPQALMAVNVMSSLIRQTLQQARDLENSLHPTTLESLGLEAALEAFTNQEIRARGLRISLSLARMLERLPYQLELALYRATQDITDQAVRRGNASRLRISLQRHDDAIEYSIENNGLPVADDGLRPMQARIEALGGTVEYAIREEGRITVVIRFPLLPDVALTEREEEVMQLLAEGLTNREIADRLHVSPRTVKFHLDNLYSKLGVNSRTEAAIYVVRRNLTQ